MNQKGLFDIDIFDDNYIIYSKINQQYFKIKKNIEFYYNELQNTQNSLFINMQTSYTFPLVICKRRISTSTNNITSEGPHNITLEWQSLYANVVKIIEGYDSAKGMLIRPADYKIIVEHSDVNDELNIYFNINVSIILYEYIIRILEYQMNTPGYEYPKVDNAFIPLPGHVGFTRIPFTNYDPHFISKDIVFGSKKGYYDYGYKYCQLNLEIKESMLNLFDGATKYIGSVYASNIQRYESQQEDRMKILINHIKKYDSVMMFTMFRFYLNNLNVNSIDFNIINLDECDFEINNKLIDSNTTVIDIEVDSVDVEQTVAVDDIGNTTDNTNTTTLYDEIYNQNMKKYTRSQKISRMVKINRQILNIRSISKKFLKNQRSNITSGYLKMDNSSEYLKFQLYGDFISMLSEMIEYFNIINEESIFFGSKSYEHRLLTLPFNIKKFYCNMIKYKNFQSTLFSSILSNNNINTSAFNFDSFIATIDKNIPELFRVLYKEILEHIIAVIKASKANYNISTMGMENINIMAKIMNLTKVDDATTEAYFNDLVNHHLQFLNCYSYLNSN